MPVESIESSSSSESANSADNVSNTSNEESSKPSEPSSSDVSQFESAMIDETSKSDKASQSGEASKADKPDAPAEASKSDKPDAPAETSKADKPDTPAETPKANKPDTSAGAPKATNTEAQTDSLLYQVNGDEPPTKEQGSLADQLSKSGVAGNDGENNRVRRAAGEDRGAFSGGLPATSFSGGAPDRPLTERERDRAARSYSAPVESGGNNRSRRAAGEDRGSFSGGLPATSFSGGAPDRPLTERERDRAARSYSAPTVGRTTERERDRADRAYSAPTISRTAERERDRADQPYSTPTISRTGERERSRADRPYSTPTTSRAAERERDRADRPYSAPANSQNSFRNRASTNQNARNPQPVAASNANSPTAERNIYADPRLSPARERPSTRAEYVPTSKRARPAESPPSRGVERPSNTNSSATPQRRGSATSVAQDSRRGSLPGGSAVAANLPTPPANASRGGIPPISAPTARPASPATGGVGYQFRPTSGRAPDVALPAATGTQNAGPVPAPVPSDPTTYYPSRVEHQAVPPQSFETGLGRPVRYNDSRPPPPDVVSDTQTPVFFWGGDVAKTNHVTDQYIRGKSSTNPAAAFASTPTIAQVRDVLHEVRSRYNDDYQASLRARTTAGAGPVDRWYSLEAPRIEATRANPRPLEAGQYIPVRVQPPSDHRVGYSFYGYAKVVDPGRPETSSRPVYTSEPRHYVEENKTRRLTNLTGDTIFETKTGRTGDRTEGSALDTTYNNNVSETSFGASASGGSDKAQVGATVNHTNRSESGRTEQNIRGTSADRSNGVSHTGAAIRPGETYYQQQGFVGRETGTNLNRVRFSGPGPQAFDEFIDGNSSWDNWLQPNPDRLDIRPYYSESDSSPSSKTFTASSTGFDDGAAFIRTGGTFEVLSKRPIAIQRS